MPDAADIDRIGQLLLGLTTQAFSIPNIRVAIAEAGLNAAALTSESERRSGYTGSRAELTPQILELWARADTAPRERAIPILAAGLQGTSHAEKAKALLEQHGYRFENGRFVEVNLVDERERAILPRSSFDELTKANARVFDGDFSGAITSACGAVDSLMQSLYKRHGWEDPPPESFQAKVNTALNRLNIFESLKGDLVASGMPENDANGIVTNQQESTQRATDSLQVLRRAMGDVHGTKSATRNLAYLAVKDASIICALFENYDK